MYTALVILIVICAILLVAIVFVQESKGGGLSSGFSENNSLLGVRKTTDFVEKATWTLAGAVVVLSVIAVLTRPTSKDGEQTTVLENLDSKPAPAAATPGLPGTPVANPEAANDEAAAAVAATLDTPASTEAAEAPANATAEAPAAEAPAAEVPASPAGE